QDNNSHTSENLNFKIISDSSQLAVTNLGLNEGIVGDNYSQTIQAEGGSHNYTISVSGLPDGLTFNSGSNTITGTPAQAGTYPITITVNDGTNNPIEKEFTLSVREGNYPVPPENCIDPCEDGDTKCTAGGYIQYCELHNTCRVWGSPHACPEGESCLNGVCGTGGVFAGNFTCDPNSPVQDNNPNWNCPFSMCHHSYCAVCEEDDANMDGTAGCDEGEGWCSGSWHCAEGLVCSPASHVCVNPENTYNNEEEHPGITLTKSDTYRKFNFRAGEVKLFKFKADSGPSNPTLTVVAEVQSHYSHGDLQMMIKYAGQDWQTGPPTESDYRSIRTIIDADWTKYIGVYNDIYYYLSRSLTKRININYTPQVTGGCWYAWVKNIGDFRLDDCMVHFHNW
ncbi:putative Ig domain-containing protein, partial [bacterium]|nr:putative Ig domain-containing protein [bacterium]